MPLGTELTARISSACENLKSLLEENMSHSGAQEIFHALRSIVIEAAENLKSFLAVTERDGDSNRIMSDTKYRRIGDQSQDRGSRRSVSSGSRC